MTQEQEARDFGSSDRHKHGKMIEVALESERLKNAKESRECFLDVLYERGSLRYPEEAKPPKDDEARRRRDAGLWLRGVYQQAGIHRRVTMAYTIFGQAEPGEHGEHCHCRECDRINWNWRCWRWTMRDLGPFALVCREICCFDRFPRGPYGDIRVALDRLADLRGM